MLALSTHDTKRSEDVRARINLLSEIPSRLEGALVRWSAMNALSKQNNAPDANTEYFLYQTLIGAWPIDSERFTSYMEKACREAKAQTSWLAPNRDFEDGLKAFIERLYDDERFQLDLAEFVQPLILPGRINSLSQTLLKFTSPGIPDTYQGCELWDLSLVDPDNRRPVDYAARSALLAELPRLTVDDIVARFDEGLPKLWLIARTVALRNQRPEDFGSQASYRPLYAFGAKASHLVAFARGTRMVAMAPRLVLTLNQDWGDTRVELPAGSWRNELTGDSLPGGASLVRDILRRFPVALLTRD